MKKQPAIILYSREELHHHIDDLDDLRNNKNKDGKRIYAIIEKDTNQVIYFRLYYPEYEHNIKLRDSVYFIKLPKISSTARYPFGVGYFYLEEEFVDPYSTRAFEYIYNSDFRISFSNVVTDNSSVSYEKNNTKPKGYVYDNKEEDTKSIMIKKLNELSDKFDKICRKLDILNGEEYDVPECNTGIFDESYKTPIYYTPLSDAEKYKRIKDGLKYDLSYAQIDSDTKQCISILDTDTGMGNKDFIYLDKETRYEYVLGYFYLNGKFVSPLSDQAKEYMEAKGYELVITNPEESGE